MHPITDALPATLCYLAGEHSARRDARIGARNCGFILGDGIQGHVPVYFGPPFCFEEHTAPPREPLPDVALDPQAIGNGRPDPIYDSLYRADQQAKVRNAQKHGAPA